jgi:hypothetical protein
MTKQRLFASLQVTGAAAMSVAGLMALSACEERPYPAPRHSAPPPSAPPADRAGAPSSPYTAPPVYQQPAPPAYQPPAYTSPPVYSTPSYDTGSVVAMAPIPNPGDPGSQTYYGGRHYGGRVHAHYDTAPPTVVAENTVTSPYGEGHPAPGRHPSYTYPAPAPTPAPPVYTPKPTPPVYAKATPPVYTPPKTTTYAKTTTTTTVAKTTTYGPKVPPVVTYDAKKIEHKSAAVAVAAGAAAGVLAMDAKHAAVQAKQAATTAYAAKIAPPKAVPAAPVPAPSGDRATNLASLQTTLTDAVGKTAVLTAPARFTANQPADVSLTLPAGFGDTVKSESQKDGLGDAAASVNMTALLSGDGFSVTPDDTQSAPLTIGQPTEFKWTVTAQPGAKGPLHADVGADLLGGGSDKLALGSVQKAAGMGIKLTPRVIGASLLVLIAALVVAWLARGRGPTRSATARRASRRAARGGRPLDMGAGADEKPAH